MKFDRVVKEARKIQEEMKQEEVMALQSFLREWLD